ncbi:MAG TPA: hypothetical protein P5539_11195 [Mesotoga sp.]|nr:hypothetical protein [Mesotoga sp.]
MKDGGIVFFGLAIQIVVWLVLFALCVAVPFIGVPLIIIALIINKTIAQKLK